MNEQQQPKEMFSNKDGFNVLRLLAAAHSMTITVFIRSGFGPQLLDKRGAYGAILLFVVAGFSGQPVMLNYLFAFLAALLIQRIKTAAAKRAGVRLHSLYDGHPWLGMFLTRKEMFAKGAVEPVLCFAAAVAIGCFGEAHHSAALLTLAGWLFIGIASLGFDHVVYAGLQHQRLREMEDAEIENEILMQQYRERKERR